MLDKGWGWMASVGDTGITDIYTINNTILLPAVYMSLKGNIRLSTDTGEKAEREPVTFTL